MPLLALSHVDLLGSAGRSPARGRPLRTLSAASSALCTGRATTASSRAADLSFDGLSGRARRRARVFDGLAGALACAFGRLFSPLTEVLDGFADFLDRPAGAFAHYLDGLAYAACDVLEDLRVAVDRCQHAIDDLRDVVEANLQQRLGLDALYVEMHTSEGHIGPYVQLEEVEHLGLKRDPRSQVLEVEVDFIDLDHRDVEQHVGGLARVRSGRGIVLVFLLGAGLPFGQVRGVAVIRVAARPSAVRFGVMLLLVDSRPSRVRRASSAAPVLRRRTRPRD